ncbi:MAG: GerMN domain-containing protein [Clostridia bacterium]|nr:GerMN domain-containing protein [Clostridia bacterium]
MTHSGFKTALLICALLACAFCCAGCAISPPDTLKRGGVESSSLISAGTENLPPEEKPVALYYRYQDAAFLASEQRMVTVQRNESIEKAIVRTLIAGPMNAELTPLFPAGSEVISTSTQGQTLFVTLNEAFLGRYADEPGDLSSGNWKTEGPLRRKLCLDSLAATMTEAGLCDRVQVLVQRDNAGQAESMRLQAGFLTRGDSTELLPPLVRSEQALLTPHNTADCVLSAWMRQDWDGLTLFFVHAPDEQSVLDDFGVSGVLLDYQLSFGSVSYDGQSAVLTADLTLRGEIGDNVVSGYPLRLIREEGLWKIEYEALLAMMHAGE